MAIFFGFRIPTHRHILYAANDYFAAMFTRDVKERSQLEITMNEVDGDILKQLVAFCYIGQITIDRENVEEMTRFASMLQFTAVAQHCTEFYLNMLCVSNCIAIREIADRHNLIELKAKAHHLFMYNFDKVSRSDDFFELSEQQLSVFLIDDGINVASEVDIFHALIGWIKYDVENRKQSLGALLECVRFKLIKDSVSKSTVLMCDPNSNCLPFDFS